MIKKCEFCNKEYDFKNYQSFGAHKTNCLHNPSRPVRLIKIKSIRVKKNEYTFDCIKCGNKYSLFLTVSNFKKHKHRKTCCNKCSHRRILSQETKNKISDSLKNMENRKMPFSNRYHYEEKRINSIKNYFSRNPNIRKGSGKGRKVSDIFKRNQSIRMIEFYKKYPEKHPNKLCAGKNHIGKKHYMKKLKRKYRVYNMKNDMKAIGWI